MTLTEPQTSDCRRAHQMAQIAAGDRYEQLLNAAYEGVDIDLDELAFWLGRYNGGHIDYQHCELEPDDRILADFLWELTRPQGVEYMDVSGLRCSTDGDMARRLKLALGAGGYAIVDITVDATEATGL